MADKKLLINMGRREGFAICVRDLYSTKYIPESIISIPEIKKAVGLISLQLIWPRRLVGRLALPTEGFLKMILGRSRVPRRCRTLDARPLLTLGRPPRARPRQRQERQAPTADS